MPVAPSTGTVAGLVSMNRTTVVVRLHLAPPRTLHGGTRNPGYISRPCESLHAIDRFCGRMPVSTLLAAEAREMHPSENVRRDIMSRLFVSGIVLAAVVGLTTPTSASPVTNDKLAYLTFTAPVQVPGVTLGAGTYRFRLTNPDTTRNVLQVLSTDGATVYAMFHTVADGRKVLTDEPVVVFRETPAGVPPAIRSLFYGGDYHGYEFVYPKGGPDMTPLFVPQPAIEYVPTPVAEEPAVEPDVEAAEPGPVEEPIFEEAEPQVAPEVSELPRTASPLPLVATGGLASLLAGLGLLLLRRRAG